MAKITQKLKTISADFSNIENQYSNNTFDIQVELNDSTFNGYIPMLSVSNPQHNGETYIVPIINKVAKLPYYCTDFLGTTTISLFGYKTNSQDTITTNKLSFEVIASNPTNIFQEPSDDNWHYTMTSYVDAQVDTIKPHIDPVTKNWFIGSTDTGVKADGTTGDYYTKTEANNTFATKTSLGDQVTFRLVGTTLEINSKR